MSNSRNRELEKKYVLEAMPEAKDLSAVMGDSLDEVRHCETVDSYWVAPGDADFVRVRESYGKKGKHCPTIPCQLLELTVKRKDKRTNLDRLERNVNIEDAKEMVRALELAFGAAPKVLKKDRELVYFLTDGTVLSFARVNGQIYFEVEAKTQALFERYVKRVEEQFGDKLRFEPKSLFELYIQG